MQRIVFGLLAILICTVAAGCGGSGGPGGGGGSTAGQPAWGMVGGNAQRQGVSGLPGPTAANLDWMYLDTTGFQQARLGPDGRCYIQCSATILCLDTAGQPSWRFCDLGGPLTGMYFDPGGLLYVVTADNRLLAVDGNGRLAAEYQLSTTWQGGSVWFTPDALYLLQQEPPADSPGLPGPPGDEYRLFAFSLGGELRWSKSVNGYGFNEVMLAASNVYAASPAPDRVYLVRIPPSAIDQNEPVALAYSLDGELLFQITADQYGYYTAAVSGDGHLYLLSATELKCYSPAGDLLLSASRDDLPITRLLAPDVGDAVYATASSPDSSQTLRLHPDGSSEVLFEHQALRIYPVPGGRVLLEYGDDYPYRLAVVEHDGQVVHDWLAPDAVNLEEKDLSFNGDSILYFGHPLEESATGDPILKHSALHRLTAEWQLEWSFVDWMGTAYTALVDSRGRLVSLGSYEGLVLDPNGNQEAYNYFDGHYIETAVLQPGTGRLITFETGGMLRAYEPDFTLAWEQPAEEVEALVATSDRLAYSGDKLVYVLDATGTQMLELETNGFGDITSSFGTDDTLYFPDRDFLYAYGPDGTPLFKTQHDNSHAGDPLVCPNGDVIVQSKHKLTAVSPGGELRWEFGQPPVSLSRAVVDQAGNLYFTAHSYSLDGVPAQLGSSSSLCRNTSADEEPFSGMYSLDSNGMQRWFTPLHGADDEAVRMIEQPVLDSQGRIYASARVNCVFAVDRQGELLWRYQLPTSSGSHGHNVGISGLNIIGGSRLAIRTPVGYVVIGN